MTRVIKYKDKLKVIAITLITIILITQITPFIRANDNNLPEEYLFLQYPTELSYSFLAKGECYLIAEIENIDYLYTTLDENEYLLSYGLNVIPIDFSDSPAVHLMTLQQISSNFIKSLSVEPLFLAEGVINTSLYQNKIVNFKAGGPISILLQPNFSYNNLYVELDGHIHKKIYNTADYPEIDSQFYSYFVEKGVYCQFDVSLDPVEHELKLKGNGTINYIIIVNSDWDNDDIADVDEVQKGQFFELDPTIPNVWGFFQKADNVEYWNYSDDPIKEARDGFFNFYIPYNGARSLNIEVYNGEFFDIIIDGNKNILNNILLTANYPNTSITTSTVQIYGAGWHFIQYKYYSGLNRIYFAVDGKKIVLIPSSELADEDGDGVKDIEESSNNLGISKEDTDNDGLPDNFDLSPLNSLILDKESINQILIPTQIEKNSLITIQIKKPNKDYSTNGVPRFWRDKLNVSIHPVLRMFGSEFQLTNESEVEALTNTKLVELWGKEVKLYSLLKNDYDAEGIGDELPRGAQSNNETQFVFPQPADDIIEYQINFPKDHHAKQDGILNLRFDFIWLVTSYDPENGTQILHYYNFEEDIILQAILLRETGNFNYLIGTPKDYVDSQVLWAIAQNPSVNLISDYDIQDEIIDQGKIDYFNIGERIMEEVAHFYNTTSSTEDIPIVFYASGLQDVSDILNDIVFKYGQDINYTYLNRFNYHSYISLNIYNENDNDNQASNQTSQGDYKILYQTSYDNFTAILGIPLEIKVETFLNSKTLTITEAVSEFIPKEDIPFKIDQDLNERIILKRTTYIESIRNNEGTPLLEFDPKTDICKIIFDNRANEIELGRLFFENVSGCPSKLSIFQSDLNTLRHNLKDLHQELLQLNTEEGVLYNGNEDLDFISEYCDIFDNFVDENGEYLSESYRSSSIAGKLALFESLETSINKLTDKLFSTKTVKVIAKLLDKSLFGAKLCKENLAARKFVFKINVLYLETEEAQSTATKWQTIKLRIKAGITVACIGLSAFKLFVDFQKFISTALQIEEFNNITFQYGAEIVKEILDVLLDSISLTTGIITFVEYLSGKAVEEMTSFSKWTGTFALAIALVITVTKISDLVDDVLNNRFRNFGEFSLQLVHLIYDIGLTIGIAILEFTPHSGYGVLIGLAMIGLDLLSNWLTTTLLYVNPVIGYQTGLILPEETLLNVRRHGSLEVGDTIKFRLYIGLYSNEYVWARARFRLEGVEGWVSSWDSWKGRWSDDYSYNVLYDVYDKSFSAEITNPTVNLVYRVQFDLDVLLLTFLWFFPYIWFQRTPMVQSDEAIKMKIPALENTISKFYDNTTEIATVEMLKYQFNNSIDNYQYKDAYDIATEIITRTEDIANIIPVELEDISSRTQDYNDTHFQIQTQNYEEFSYFIDKYFAEGFRAKDLIPESLWETLESQDDKYINLASYSESDGVIIFDKTWINVKFEQLGDVRLYEQLREDLPIKTNINMDSKGGVIKLSPTSGSVEVNLKLQLEGPDNPNVDIKLEPSEGFLITPNQFNQPLSSKMIFTLQDKDLILISGFYSFKLKIFLAENMIYQMDVPFTIETYKDIAMEVSISNDPINPGETVYLANVTNKGTVSEIVQLIVEGIPEEFIVEGLYSEEFEDSSIFFEIFPGETRQCLVIKPPISFNTQPGVYEFSLILKSAYLSATYYDYQGSFNVAEFYDLDFQCSNPEIIILDNETCTFDFSMTNLGNIIDDFTITYTDIIIGTSYLEQNVFTLAPGQTQYFSIIISPKALGTQTFVVTTTSMHLSKVTIATLNIEDDDLIAPYFSIEVKNCISDEEPGFWRILAEDASGIFEIGLIIDGINLTFTQADFGTGTIIELQIPINNELGEHTCEGYVIDADMDLGTVDQLTTLHPVVSCNIKDDDIDPPILFNLMISDTIHELFIFFEASDLSGFKKTTINIDNDFKVTYSDFPNNQFNFIIFNYWIMEFGMHNIEIEVWDADEDRLNDSLYSKICGTFDISLEDMKQYVSWEDEQLINEILSSPNVFWREENYKAAMINKLEELKELISENRFEEAYNKLLHDIKPKLTGFKTDEDEIPWGNGIFKIGWVVNDNLQELFRLSCNKMLSDIKILTATLTSIKNIEMYKVSSHTKIVPDVNKSSMHLFNYLFLLISLAYLPLSFSKFRCGKKNYQ